MIRDFQLEDLDEVVGFIQRKNMHPLTHSSYMSNHPNRIRQDVIETTTYCSNHVLVSIDENKVNGVIVSFYQAERDCFDIAGPYVEHDDLTIAKALVEAWKAQFHEPRIQFFFNQESLFFIQLMNEINATLDQKEYLLELHVEQLPKDTLQVQAYFMTPMQHQAVMDVFDEIFPNTYMTSKQVIESHPEQHVILLDVEGLIAGVAFLKQYSTTYSLEFFGLRSQFRGKNLAKPFLSSVIHLLQSKVEVQAIRLVVDAINERAIRIYLDLGFTIHQMNLSYYHCVKEETN